MTNHGWLSRTAESPKVALSYAAMFVACLGASALGIWWLRYLGT